MNDRPLRASSRSLIALEIILCSGFSDITVTHKDETCVKMRTCKNQRNVDITKN